MSKWIWYEDIWAVKWFIILSKLFVTKGLPAFFTFFYEFMYFVIPITLVIYSLVYATENIRGLIVVVFFVFWVIKCAARWFENDTM